MIDIDLKKVCDTILNELDDKVRLELEDKMKDLFKSCELLILLKDMLSFISRLEALKERYPNEENELYKDGLKAITGLSAEIYHTAKDELERLDKK